MLVLSFALLGTPQVFAQTPSVCHLLCTPKVKVEPTVTFTNLFGSPRMVGEQGTTTRERRETEFEVIVSVGLPTRAPWLEFTDGVLTAPTRCHLSSGSPTAGANCVAQLRSPLHGRTG